MTKNDAFDVKLSDTSQNAAAGSVLLSVSVVSVGWLSDEVMRYIFGRTI
jgi:hypothetical protein